jgi:formylmethanofuran dehydrogenase subunit C
MIRLSLRGRPPTRLSLRGLLPERFARLSAGTIERQPLRQGNRAGVLGDWFAVDVTGSAEDRLVISGASDRIDDVGAEMTGGELVIEGDVGSCVGLEMGGGRIMIEGSAGFGGGMAMRGGELRIAGDAGDHLGGALPGEREGARGGMILVHGNAGTNVGDRMRLGLMVVLGSVGAFCGARMSAGTIVVGGEVGAGAGAAMRRGTLIATRGNLRPLPGFADNGVHELAVLRVLGRVLAKHHLSELATQLSGLRRWQGDLAVDGKGEIWTPP